MAGSRWEIHSTAWNTPHPTFAGGHWATDRPHLNSDCGTLLTEPAVYNSSPKETHRQLTGGRQWPLSSAATCARALCAQGADPAPLCAVCSTGRASSRPTVVEVVRWAVALAAVKASSPSCPSVTCTASPQCPACPNTCSCGEHLLILAVVLPAASGATRNVRVHSGGQGPHR